MRIFWHFSMTLNKLLIKYITKIATEPKSIKEKIEEQDRPTVPAEVSEDERKFYDELLKLLEPKNKKEKE